MSTMDSAVQIIKQQILAKAEANEQELKHWKADIDIFCEIALSGKTYEYCIESIGKSYEEGKEYGFDRLHPLYVDIKNAQVAGEAYRRALEESDPKMISLIAETRLGWSKTQKLEHSNPQDDFAKAFSGLLDDESSEG